MTVQQCQQAWLLGPARSLSLDRPRLMGVLNVTPDSFSDGGLFQDASSAVDHALLMVEAGASIIDVGGESTRPGAARVDADEQIRRTGEVIGRLRAASDVIISIDTTRSAVATAALDAGADIVNDVSAGREDPDMLPLCAARDCGVVLMHRLHAPGEDSYSDSYVTPPHYDDVVRIVAEFLQERAEAAEAAGVGGERIVLDPGLGFGKTVGQNYELIARCGELLDLGYHVLSGASRKSFLGRIARMAEPRERDAASVAVAVVQYLAGVRLFRVHDVAGHRQALAVAESIAAAG